jgi:hypothetical protein
MRVDGSEWELMRVDESEWVDESGWKWMKVDESWWDRMKVDESGWEWMRGNESEWEWMRVDESGWEWMRVNESGWEWMRVNKSGWKWMRVDESEWKWMKVDESWWEWMKLVESLCELELQPSLTLMTFAQDSETTSDIETRRMFTQINFSFTLISSVSSSNFSTKIGTKPASTIPSCPLLVCANISIALWELCLDSYTSSLNYKKFVKNQR